MKASLVIFFVFICCAMNHTFLANFLSDNNIEVYILSSMSFSVIHREFVGHNLVIKLTQKANVLLNVHVRN